MATVTRPLSVCARDCEALAALTEIHAPHAKVVVDCSWGKGAIWRGWEPPFRVIKSDIDPYGSPDMLADYHRMPILPGVVDVLVWDPPHLEDVGKNALMAKYNGHATLSLISSAAIFIPQARHILRIGGLLLIKIADGVHAGRYHAQHSRIWFTACGGGFESVDCIIRIRNSSPNGNWKHVLHVRSAHCYWLAFKRVA